MKYEIEVSQMIPQSAEIIFPYLSNLEHFMEWNPFPEMDASAVSTLSEQTAGIGAILHWKGKRIGEGEMKLADLVENESVSFDMTFGTGSKAEKAYSCMCIQSLNTGESLVTWKLNGERNFFVNLLFKIIGLDRMMSKHFQEGLNSLNKCLNTVA